MNVYVRELGKALAQRGFLIDIFTRWSEPHVPQILSLGEGVRVVHLKGGLVGEMDKNAIYFHLPEMACNLIRFKESHGLHYHLLHSHYWLSGVAARWMRERWGIPHVAMFHTLAEVKNHSRLGEREPTLRIEAERKVVATADRLIAPNPQERGQLIRFYNASPAKIAVIPCGVDLELFKPMDKALARRRLGLTDSRIILFVGRMDPLKGLDILLRAVAKQEDRAGLLVLVVGGKHKRDPILESFRSMAGELGIGDKVRFLGSLKQDELPLYYNAADICVVPSYYESFSLVAVEALACGTPVIASRVGGLTNIVRDGETGFLIPWRCPDPFSERLETLLGNEMLRENFGRAARGSVLRFAWPNIARQVAELYLGLIEEGELKPEVIRSRVLSPTRKG
jgi:D-inositol-3-phosphate glycosyltransferase